MFIEWSAGAAESFASLPDGCLWDSHWGEAERNRNLCCQNSSSIRVPSSSAHTAEYIWLLTLIKRIFNSWDTFLTLSLFTRKPLEEMLIYKNFPKTAIETKTVPAVCRELKLKSLGVVHEKNLTMYGGRCHWFISRLMTLSACLPPLS